MSASDHAAAVVTAFVFAAVLGVTFMSSHVQSKEISENFDTCEQCVVSECYMHTPGACVPTGDNAVSTECFQCKDDEATEEKQFYFKADCEACCPDPTKCACDGKCWKCVESPDTDITKFKCETFTTALNCFCENIPFTNTYTQPFHK